MIPVLCCNLQDITSQAKGSWFIILQWLNYNSKSVFLVLGMKPESLDAHCYVGQADVRRVCYQTHCYVGHRCPSCVCYQKERKTGRAERKGGGESFFFLQMQPRQRHKANICLQTGTLKTFAQTAKKIILKTSSEKKFK